tara:strand:- start:888 stop:1505 length:618 start_codon:yes stop_codon:yes gene_type:complete
MYYYTYKVLFENGDYYLGQHTTHNLNDGYSGSGKKLNERNDPFDFEILEYYDSKEDLDVAEKELIGDLWYTDPKCLNLKEGGTGGWAAVNKTLDRSYMLTEEYREKMRQVAIRLHKEGKISNCFTIEDSIKGNKRLQELYPKGTFFGKSHTEETKKKIGLKNAKHQKGKGNSQYGKMWITNEQESTRINKGESIPEGWRKGRVII